MKTQTAEVNPPVPLSQQVEAALQRKRELRKAAADELKDIVLRSDNAQPGDAERVLVLVDELGIRLDALESVFDLIRKRAEDARLLEDEGPATRAELEARRAITAIDEWRDQEKDRIDREADVKRAPLFQAQGAAQGRMRAAQKARQFANYRDAEWAIIRDGIAADEAFRFANGAPGSYRCPLR